MKRFYALWMILCTVCLGASSEWCTLEDIQELSDALYVTKFPILQKELFTKVGLHSIHPSWGGSASSGTSFQFYTLTKLGAGEGEYAIKVTLKSHDSTVPPEEAVVINAELYYINKLRQRFKLEYTETQIRLQVDFWDILQRKKILPKDWAKQRRLEREELECDLEAGRKELEEQVRKESIKGVPAGK